MEKEEGFSRTGRPFVKYVSQNILGTIGVSAYILADTFFISQSEGADGITALNLVLPVYSLIFAIGSMIGVGSATRFALGRARGDEKADCYFSNAVFWAILLGICFMIPGMGMPDKVLSLLGGDARIVEVGTEYTRIFLFYSPFFMLNYIFNAFVRNDGDPSLAMAATMSSSLFNIVMDYVLIFPCGLGMSGAALATGLSPVVGMTICGLHFFSKKNTVTFRWKRPTVSYLVKSCQLGVAAFMGEMSSGVTTMVFNLLILGIAGNTGIAAYGVVANIAIVGTAIFNGISQGTQPLFSDTFGRGEKKSVNRLLQLAVVTAFASAIILLLVLNLFAEPIVQVFNQQGDTQLTAYAIEGVRLYFIGFLCSGFNIVGTGYLSATEKAAWAFAASILRGFVAITLCALLLSHLFGMAGVWLAFPVSELLTAIVIGIAIVQSRKA